jgi:CDP-glucose 4,6-dehydratase
MRINKDNTFWKNKKVLITGDSGFKGSWLSLMLLEQGAKVYGLSLANDNSRSVWKSLQEYNNFHKNICDIRDFKKVKTIVSKINPQIVFHLAAQPLVRESYCNPIYTYETNVIGTVNLLESLKTEKELISVVCITSDKCYENIEKNYAYKESDKMGGYDPYSSSKGCAEIVISAYQRSYYNNLEIALSSARAGNVIGGGDWSKDRIIPDIVNSYENGKILKVRYPDATRPFQHVIEPLYGYMQLAKKTSVNREMYQGAYNFGPNTSDTIKVSSLVKLSKKIFPNLNYEFDHQNNNLHEANLLKLDITKTTKHLNCLPKWDIETTLERTLIWYKNVLDGQSVIDATIKDINEYYI